MQYIRRTFQLLSSQARQLELESRRLRDGGDKDASMSDILRGAIELYFSLSEHERDLLRNGVQR